MKLGYKFRLIRELKQDLYFNQYPKVSKTRNTVWVRLIWLESMSCLEMFKDLEYV